MTLGIIVSSICLYRSTHALISALIYLLFQILPCRVHLNQPFPSTNSPNPLNVVLSRGFSPIFFNYPCSAGGGIISAPQCRKGYLWHFLYILSIPFKIFILIIPPTIIIALIRQLFSTGILINAQFKLKVIYSCPWKKDGPKCGFSQS